MFRTHHAAMIVIFLATVASYARGSDNDPPPSRLLASAPIIDTREGTSKVLRVTQQNTSDDALKLCLLFRAPGHYAHSYQTRATGRPIAFYSDENMLLYNCYDDYVYYTTKFQLQYNLKQSDGSLVIDLDFKRVDRGLRDNF